MGLLDSRRAVVTGGGSGIGQATCRRMTDEGARVAVVDINGDAAEQVAKEIDGLAYAVDVTDYDALSAAVDDAAAKLDGLSTVFNNAGASNLSQVHEWPVDEWDRIVRLNLATPGRDQDELLQGSRALLAAERVAPLSRFASSTTVSFVEHSPSTEIALKLSSTAARRKSFASPGSSGFAR